jgi:hypothetical protein
MPPDPLREQQRDEGFAEIEAELDGADERQAFEEMVARLNPARGNYVDFVTRGLSHLLEACSAAQGELAATIDERRGFEAGTAWDQMIRDLLDWAKSRGYPATISMGRQKSSKVVPPSPFVRFVQELQKLFPDGYARHQHSVDGLAGAISRARRQRRGGARNTHRAEAQK